MEFGNWNFQPASRTITEKQPRCVIVRAFTLFTCIIQDLHAVNKHASRCNQKLLQIHIPADIFYRLLLIQVLPFGSLSEIFRFFPIPQSVRSSFDV